ncbi:MAG: HAMP domain-containing histidine kinase [bacterium]|nr:HAMP domain-containing histidine kinase [bacterium]
MIFKKDPDNKLLERTLQEIEAFNYPDQFLPLAPDFFAEHLPVKRVSLFFFNHEQSRFIPYLGAKYRHLKLQPITPDSHLVVYLKNSKKTIVFKEEEPSVAEFLKTSNPDLFQLHPVDLVIPLLSMNRFHAFVVIAAGAKTYKELEPMENYFKLLSNMLIPLIVSERIQIANNKNYYKIYRMDRLAMVGELAASAAHEIKNPLAGIYTYLNYFTELEDFTRNDIIEEVTAMKQSIRRIDEIIRSLLGFSKYTQRKVGLFSLSELIESSLASIRLKVPPTTTIVKEMEDELMVNMDFQHLQQVVINIIFNAAEAIGTKPGKIVIHTYVSGRDQLPSKEMYNVSIKDNGPGIDPDFQEQLFQPFHSSKEEGTGLGLYTCLGLMKSMGGNITINSSDQGTEVIISFPYSFEDDEE